MISVNLDSLMHCAIGFKVALTKNSGNLIIISAVARYHAQMGTPAYAASKFAAISLTQSLAQGWAREGIRMNGMAPGMA